MAFPMRRYDKRVAYGKRAGNEPAYLEERQEASAGNKPPSNTLFQGPAHTYCSEMVEVQVPDEAAWVWVVRRRHCDMDVA